MWLCKQLKKKTRSSSQGLDTQQAITPAVGPPLPGPATVKEKAGSPKKRSFDESCVSKELFFTGKERPVPVRSDRKAAGKRADDLTGHEHSQSASTSAVAATMMSAEHPHDLDIEQATFRQIITFAVPRFTIRAAYVLVSTHVYSWYIDGLGMVSAAATTTVTATTTANAAAAAAAAAAVTATAAAIVLHHPSRRQAVVH